MALSRISLALAACLVSCSARPQPPAPPLAPPAADDTGSTGAENAPSRVVERIAVFQDRVGGGGATSYFPDGRIEFSYAHVENGRGPKLQGHALLAGDGTLAAFRATGSQTFGAPIDETFEIVSGVARWQSLAETGERTLDGPAFYVPMAPWPEQTALLFEALVQAGGELALLPAGQASLTQLGTATVNGPEGPRTLTAWQIAGLGFEPEIVWADEDRRFVGGVDEYMSYLDSRWQHAIPPLVKAKKQYVKERDAALAAELARRPPEAGLAIVGARVLDVRRGRWLTEHTVIIKGDRIAAVGPSRRVKPPAGAEVIDAQGKALIPGLWDMHAHLGGADGILNLASGVTTARDLGNEPDALDELKARFDAGEAIGPHVLRSGFIEGRGPSSASSKIRAETEAEAREAVEFYAERGYEGIKIYNSMKAELVPLLARLAHERGMRVSGHVPAFMRAEDVVRAGYDEIQHINMLFLNFLVEADTDTRTLARFTLVAEGAPSLDLDSEPVRDFIDLLARKKIVVDPTLAVFEWMFLSQPGDIAPGLRPMVTRLPVLVQRGFRSGGLATGPGQAERYREAYARMLALVKRLHDAGVRLVPGTDFTTGLGLHRELALYVEAGIPPADVLRIATLGAAQVMKRDGDTGSIEKGKIADLVLLDGDPLTDIADLRHTVMVVKAGVTYPTAALYEAVGVAP